MIITLGGYIWCAAAGLFSALATVMLKISSNHSEPGMAVKLCWLAGAMTSYVAGFGAYRLALAKTDITVAYPMMTIVTMTLIAFAGRLIFGEALSVSKAIGIVLLCISCVLLTK